MTLKLELVCLQHCTFNSKCCQRYCVHPVCSLSKDIKHTTQVQMSVVKMSRLSAYMKCVPSLLHKV